MAKSETRKAERSANDGPTKVAVACQGGGMHAAFALGVLKAILEARRGQHQTQVRTGGIERDVGRRPVRVDGLVRPCSEEGNPGLRHCAGSDQKARRLLAGLRCQNGR